MAQNDMLKRYLEAGLAFTQMTRDRAEEIIKDLIDAGEVQREQASTRIDELVERSRKNTELLLDIVRTEVRDQVGALNLVNRDELTKLMNRFTGGGDKGTESAQAATATAVKKASSKPAETTDTVTSTTVKKAMAKKGGAKKGGIPPAGTKIAAPKPTATKPVAKKTATKAAGTKATGKKAPAAKAAGKKAAGTKAAAKKASKRA